MSRTRFEMPFLSRRDALCLSAAGAIGLLSGCKSGSTGDKNELTIWSAPTGFEERGFMRLCERFEQQHPGIHVHNVGATSEEKVIRAIVAGAPPDLAYMFGQTFVGPLAAYNAIQPLDAYFAQAGFKETDFLPSALTSAKYQGQLYAMPVTRDSRALYWNRTCFREAGLDPDTPPMTTEEVITFAKKLTRRNQQGVLDRLGMFLPDFAPMAFGLFGGKVWDEKTGQITANSPENIEALHWMLELSDAQGGYVAVSALASGFGRSDSAQNPIATGKIAMKLEGEWAAMHLEKFAPTTDYKLGEMPYPASRPELRNMAWQDGDVMIIPTGARNPNLAWEFMRWMQKPEQQLEYALFMNNLPSIVSLRDAKEFTTGSRSRRALGYVFKHIASDPRNPSFFPALPVAQLYRSALTNAVDQTLYHSRSPEQALGEVQQRIEKEMERQKI